MQSVPPYLSFSKGSQLLTGICSSSRDKQNRLAGTAAAAAVAVAAFLSLHKLAHADWCWAQAGQLQQLAHQFGCGIREAAHRTEHQAGTTSLPCKSAKQIMLLLLPFSTAAPRCLLLIVLQAKSLAVMQTAFPNECWH
jgi:hypothetical protein